MPKGGCSSLLVRIWLASAGRVPSKPPGYSRQSALALGGEQRVPPRPILTSEALGRKGVGEE